MLALVHDLLPNGLLGDLDRLGFAGSGQHRGLVRLILLFKSEKLKRNYRQGNRE